MTSIVRHRTVVMLLIVGVITLTTTATVAYGQQERSEAEQQEVMSLATIVGAALQGQIIPTDEPFVWTNDFLKSTQQTTFVPFTLSVDQSKISTPAVAMYIFVAPQGAPAVDPSVADAPAERALLPRLRSQSRIGEREIQARASR